MANLMIPGPAAEPEKNGQEHTRSDGGGAHAEHQPEQHRAEKADVPSPEDCVRAIVCAARMTAMGVITPSAGNTVRGSYRDVLVEYHKAKAKDAEKKIANSDVLEILNKDPRLLNFLEPILGQEQIDLIMKKV